MLDLTGRGGRTSPAPVDQAAPYYLTTERVVRPRPKAPAAARRPPRKLRPAASVAPLSAPAHRAAPPVTAAPPSVPAEAPAPDYGRWTVAPGAWPEAGRGVGMSVCDPANLASVPAASRKACAERMKRASIAGPPARHGAVPDWKEHNPISCVPQNEPGNKLILDHCSPVGGTGVGFTLKYKF